MVRALEEFECTPSRQKDCSNINEPHYPMFSKANLEENGMSLNQDALYKLIQCAKLTTAPTHSISHGSWGGRWTWNLLNKAFLNLQEVQMQSRW